MNAIVETGPTLSKWFFSGTDAVAGRRAGIDDEIGDVENRLAAGMARLLSLGRGGRAVGDDFHAALLGLEGDVDVHVVDARVREDPHAVARIEVVALHDRHAVALGPLEKQELVHAASPTIRVKNVIGSSTIG